MAEGVKMNKKFFVMNVIIRLWCFTTVVVLWILSIQLLKKEKTRSYAVSWYLLSVTILSTILEGIWILNKLPWFQENACCYCRCWKYASFINKWKKGSLYIVLSLPTFWISKNTTEGHAGGSILLVAGILLLFKSVFSLFFRQDSEEQKYFLKTNPNISNTVSHEAGTQTDESEYTRPYQ